MFVADVNRPRLVRFGVFELDRRSGELRRAGARVALQPQPFRILTQLLDRPGEIVTRDELRRELWPNDTFVDFEHSVNVAVARVREALGDDAERPRFVETLPRRGYRFVAPVEIVDNGAAPDRRGRRWLWAALAGAAAAGATLAMVAVGRPPALTDHDTLLVADFVNTTGDTTFNGTLRQGLTVQLEQSPFLSVVSQDRIASTLRQMTRSPEDPVVGSLAREVCQRVGAKIVVNGSIAPLGQHYVIGLEAVNCLSGETAGTEQADVSRRELVLSALGSSASRLRRRLGESIATIRRFDTPLAQATTPSLDALKAFSIGQDIFTRTGKAADAASFLTRAIQLDGNFAMAYARLSAVSAALGRWDDEVRYAREASARRDAVTERERFYIDGRHCVVEHRPGFRTDCMIAAHDLWRRVYPRDWLPYSNLAGAYSSGGQYDAALDNGLEAIRLNPDAGIAHMIVVDTYMALNRYADAKHSIEAAHARHLFDDWFHVESFQLAFAEGDDAGMARARLEVSGTPDEGSLVWLDAEAAAFRGGVKRARVLRARAERLSGPAVRQHFAAQGALFDAAFGLEARTPDVARATTPITRYTVAAAALLSRDVERAVVLLGEDETPPEMRGLVTASRALAAAQTGDASATEALFADRSTGIGQFLGFTPVYLRGLAYLRCGDAASAAAEFQRILDHRGVAMMSPLYPLAHVQRARADVLAGDLVQARRHYQMFLTLWTDADADVPILQEAKAEYARLGRQ